MDTHFSWEGIPKVIEFLGWIDNITAEGLVPCLSSSMEWGDSFSISNLFRYSFNIGLVSSQISEFMCGITAPSFFLRVIALSNFKEDSINGDLKLNNLENVTCSFYISNFLEVSGTIWITTPELDVWSNLFCQLSREPFPTFQPLISSHLSLILSTRPLKADTFFACWSIQPSIELVGIFEWSNWWIPQTSHSSYVEKDTT